MTTRVRPWAVRLRESDGSTATGIVITETAFAACFKFTRTTLRRHRTWLKPRVVRLYDEGTIAAVPLHPFRIGPERFAYCTGVAHAARRASPVTVPSPCHHYDVLVTLPKDVLIAQLRHVWPRNRGSFSYGVRRYAPHLEFAVRTRPELVTETPRIKRLLEEAAWFGPWKRRLTATALCLALADPTVPKPLGYLWRHPSERKRKGAAGAAPARHRTHPNLDRADVDALLRDVGPDLTYPASVLATLRRLAASHGVDPATLTWAELRALWRGGREGLDAYRIDGRDPATFFRD